MSYLKKTTYSLAMSAVLIGCGGVETKSEKIEIENKKLENSIVVSEKNIEPSLQEKLSLPVVSEPILPETVVLAPNSTNRENKAAESSSGTVAGDDDLVNLAPNSHLISLKVKSEKHPFYGVGDSKGFIIDGVEGKELVLKRGERYHFQVNSTPMHDAYISTDEMGWGAKVVEEGVEGNFTFDGVMTIMPNENTPDVVFYQCQNHKAMGARFFVVDQNDTRTLADLTAEYGALGVVDSGGRKADVSSSEVKQKLSYASLVAMSKPAKRVKNSNNPEAKSLLESSQKKLSEARLLQNAGDNRGAMLLIDEALRNMSLASRMVPSESVKNEQEQRYHAAVKLLAQQEKSHKDASDRLLLQGGDVVEYSRDDVSVFKSAAKLHADEKRYAAAISDIQQADRVVTTALNEMLDSQTIKYELNLDTPQGEYKYEHNRYLGYAELIPVAIEEKKPSKGQMMLLNGFVNKSKAMNAQGEAMAEEGNFPDAIRLTQEATKQVRRALRMLGVKQ
ncbi:hypothetical protein MNBD_GAMMA18-253 [hydrothermal vent metagenome]|uniref:Lipoprotein n=1 Tax=hydrothermal vent metagenome TaxID=652676 RepID=A0A3B0Z984_9ZZZZ